MKLAPGEKYRNAAGQIIYDGGVVENWSSPNGDIRAIFIDINGNRTELPGVHISPLFSSEGAGETLPGAGESIIYLDPRRNGLADIQHEYGHYLDYKQTGWFYYHIVVVPLSSFDAATAGSHQYYWTEVRADRLAIKFFGPNSAIGRSKLYPR